MTEQMDPRPGLRQAQDWIAGLVDAVPADRMGDPTPCGDWDVRQLLGHLTAAVDRFRVLGAGGDPRSIPQVLDPADDPAVAYRQAVERFWEVWDDDTLLARPFTAPWGTVPGAQLLAGSTMEAVTHGWDLAVATGQDSEAPAPVAERALAVARVTIPAQGRENVPFSDPVPVAAGAGPTEQLAAWLGRTRP